MSNYVLIKSYNPAYRYWIRALLKKKRIMGEREYSWKEAQQMSMDMAARGVRDEFFQRYFWSWREHPEHPPDYLYLLRMALPIYKDEKPDFEAIARLDKEARTRNQRILLTIEDAAQDFHNFYDDFLAKPLARDLERGADGKTLITYFEYEELGRIPDIRTHTQEEAERGEHTIAVELLEWLRMITPEKILDDIKQTLDRHYVEGLSRASLEHSYICKSKYVELSAHLESGSTVVTTFLVPARGYGVVKRGYAGVYHPMYYVYVPTE